MKGALVAGPYRRRDPGPVVAAACPMANVDQTGPTWSTPPNSASARGGFHPPDDSGERSSHDGP